MKVTKGYKTDRAAASLVDVISQSLKDSFVEDLLSANYYSLLPILSKKGEPVVNFSASKHQIMPMQND